MNNLLEIFCDVDDFCLAFLPEWEKLSISNGSHKRRAHKMTMSERMTLLILFHSSHYRDFKNFYKGFVDSTSLKVCHSMRIPHHRTFCGIARRGKSSMGWFYGFKLHLIVNHKGEIIEAKITSGSVHDTQPVAEMAHSISGKLYGDKGYISKTLSQNLREKGLDLITNVRKNMKARVLSAWDRAMLSRRFIIETIIDQLKNISQIEHSRHRSLNGFIVNILGGLIAYSLKKDKPHLNITEDEEHSMIVA